MSARKPLARMESSSSITEASEKEQTTTADSYSTAAETKATTPATENGDKPNTETSTQLTELQIKQELLDPDEVKRTTRNSPTVTTASPIKKKSPPDSQEQESNETTQPTAVDEASKSKETKVDKPAVSRGRKPLDQSAGKSPSVPPTNRLTRKAAMKDWAENTRLTRARRASAGIGARPETPPNPKRKYASRKQQQTTEPAVPAVKRKRSLSPKAGSDEPLSKIIKTEVPEFDLDSITIKQECLESSEEMTSDVASDITDMFPAEPSVRISLRTRKTTMCYSPTTRPYRKDKDKTDTKETKKKRPSRIRPDEDSKDSMASSILEDDVATEMKPDATANGGENPTDTEEQPANETTAKATETEETKEDQPPSVDDSKISKSSESIDKPLSVDTSEPKKDEVPSTSAEAATPAESNASDKSASLSPDLVSEGVCEISVKQFYKKPEFLENNLGIENDPKLGGIVQNVAERIEDEPVDQTSVSNESMKEGELVFEEDEEVESIGTIKNDHEEDEDVRSVSTGFISPLIVEEEDEEEEESEERTILNGEENLEETSACEKTVLLEETNKPETESEKGEPGKSESEKGEPEVVKETTPEVLNIEEIKSKEEPAKEDVKEMKTDETISKEAKLEPSLAVEMKEEAEPTKTEICDKKDIVKDESSEVVKTVKTESKELVEEQKPPPAIEEMEVDEPKVESNAETKIKVDQQEENKENVELKVEPIKPEEPEQVQVKNPTTTDEKESPASDVPEESPSNSSSKNSSPSKSGGDAETAAESSSGEATTSSSTTTSPQSSTKSSSNVPRTPENDEKLRQKERHLKTLGLLTHKAADEAIMAKQKRRKFLHNLSNNSSSKKNAAAQQSGSTATASTTTGNGQKSSQEYTGTLKTIIKINRQSSGNGNVNGNGSTTTNDQPRKSGNGSSNKAGTSGYQGSRRQSLKMTFQKGRGRPANTEKCGETTSNASGDDSYYTIQNEAVGASSTASASTVQASETTSATSAVPAAANASNQGRKSYNRSNTLNTTDPTPQAEHHETTANSKKEEKEEILIPEKASSFKFHPGRLCQDQCYYCSGKFGLYDTPCHVGQIKSLERQQKILSNEEKLTVDNCLCDACFRHVDRRANVPSYKKRLSVPGRIETTPAPTPKATPVATPAAPETTPSVETTTETPLEESEKSQHLPANCSVGHICAVPDCGQKAAHSLRRKGIRKSIKKSLLNFDMSATGTYLHICDKHYEAVVQSSGCVLCKRRLGKNNMYHITTDTDRLEKALADMGIPVTMGQGTAVCKLCRYFANLLIKPPEHGKVQKVEFVKNYRKRLLQFYNIHDKKDTSQDDDKDKEKDKSFRKQKSSSLLDEPIETIEVPASPAHSTGSSVEMISDGGLFSGDESLTAKKSTTTPSNSSSNQMILDNDVLVDYDVPMISDTSSTGSSNSTSPSPLKSSKQAKDQQSKLKAILQSVGTSLEDRNDISTALRSNPNISMRELFPGEEDLGLQFKAPFGSRSTQRTPEGWTRINTFLQYDEPTRRLWEDLQKPYGNQSSFLRHLILLEKYYRNGDLILSSNASSNATVYTQTVRNRLTSFDSRCSSPSSVKDVVVESRPRSLSVDKIQRQLSSNSVTIIARPKEQPKEAQSKPKEPKDLNSSAPLTMPQASTPITTPVPNSRSILKANVGAPKGNSSIEIVSLNSTPSSKSNSPNRSGSTTPNESILMTKQQKILAAANKLMSNKLESSPTHQKKAAFNTTPPELISLNKRPAAQQQQQQQQQHQSQRALLPKPMKPIPPNVVVLPDTLTAQERLESKSWRPTLLPVTTSHHLNNQQGPLYQTADGRRLPALVQVQSGGRPFLISIHDYNRMCILRREKLMRDQMLKGSRGKVKAPGAIFPPATCNNGKQPPAATSSSSSSSSSSSNAALASLNKTMQAVNAAENAAKKQRLMYNKPASHYPPIAPKPATQTSTISSATITSQTQSPQATPSSLSVKPMSLLSTANASSNLSSILSGQVLSHLKPTTSTSGTAVGVPTNSWLWNNFPDSNQMLNNGKSSSSSSSSSTSLISTAAAAATASLKGPQIPPYPTTMKQQSLLLDNSLMSKIPKSLTVIPQHKLMPAPTPAHQTGMGSGNITKSKD